MRNTRSIYQLRRPWKYKTREKEKVIKPCSNVDHDSQVNNNEASKPTNQPINQERKIYPKIINRNSCTKQNAAKKSSVHAALPPGKDSDAAIDPGP